MAAAENGLIGLDPVDHARLHPGEQGEGVAIPLLRAAAAPGLGQRDHVGVLVLEDGLGDPIFLAHYTFIRGGSPEGKRRTRSNDVCCGPFTWRASPKPAWR